jgi:hypothetical protein
MLSRSFCRTCNRIIHENDIKSNSRYCSWWEKSCEKTNGVKYLQIKCIGIFSTDDFLRKIFDALPILIVWFTCSFTGVLQTGGWHWPSFRFDWDVNASLGE